MCAIAGMIDLPLVTDSVIKKMKQTMKRRGPDGWGSYQKDNVTLLHSRLAIIDPEGGSQPMHLDWNSDHYVLIYNGELYNSEEIRKELTDAGHTFIGHSDTEVVLHAYAQWGMECVNRFNGIFAFGVWEENNQRLFLARDRIGVKPLFYSIHNKGLIFASEIKTILCYPEIKAQIDQTGIYQLLLLGPGRIPGSGVFRSIYEVEPGYCGYFQEGKFVLRQYWKLTDRIHTSTFEETAEQVRFLVLDSIKRQMVSDMPVGTFLSGGLDSSIISAVCAEEVMKAAKSLDTFSVDYLNNDRYFTPGKFQPNSDNAYIEIMRKSISANHHTTVLTPDDLSDALEASTIARDLPGMADVDFSLLCFCKEIRPYVKVALSGECADEIFGGYPWYRDPEIREKAGFPWSQTIDERTALLHGDWKKFHDPKEFVMDAYMDTCHSSDILPENTETERRMKELVNLNFRWFMQTLLDRKDRMSMYNSLEVRVPFCDYRIAEYLYAVPWNYKDYKGREKGLLRYAVRDLLPDAVLYRKKSPYPKTFDPQYEKIIGDRLKKVMTEKESPIFALVDREALTAFLTSESQWPWYGQLMRRPQIMAYMLQIDFWLRYYRIDIIN